MAKLILKPRIGVKEIAVDGFEKEGRISFTASLITQGKHRFYTLSMPSDVLASTCIVIPRNEDPREGFQRVLDGKRAQDIANYIDSDLGTIPSSIVLSAQEDADLEYSGSVRTLSFRKVKAAFLILDGQHRVYGFRLARSKLRVPVVIYNDLSRTEETRLFMDINTKQKPVPTELLLDIKRLASTESNSEALFHDVFDLFQSRAESPLFGLMSPTERKSGKISRVTFNKAMKSVADSFADATAEEVYGVLSAYLTSCVSGLRGHDLEEKITNPTLFRALILLFPTVAEKVSDRHGTDFTVNRFGELVTPFFERIKKSEVAKPGNNINALHDMFKKNLQTKFSIKATRGD